MSRARAPPRTPPGRRPTALPARPPPRPPAPPAGRPRAPHGRPRPGAQVLAAPGVEGDHRQLDAELGLPCGGAAARAASRRRRASAWRPSSVSVRACRMSTNHLWPGCASASSSAWRAGLLVATDRWRERQLRRRPAAPLRARPRAAVVARPRTVRSIGRGSHPAFLGGRARSPPRPPAPSARRGRHARPPPHRAAPARPPRACASSRHAGGAPA